MDMQKLYKGIWTVMECADGKPIDGSLELLCAGRRLAQAAGCPLSAVVFGSGNRSALNIAASHGADKVYFVDGGAYDDYHTDSFTNAMAALVEKYSPEAILMSGTTFGRDLAPRLAARLKTGLVADCTALRFDGEKDKVIWTRPAYSGNLMADIICPDSQPQMGTIRPGVFLKPHPTDRKAEIITEHIAQPQDVGRVCLLKKPEQEGPKNDAPKISNDIIVSMGRGAATIDGLDLICDLADALNADIGASKPVVEKSVLSQQYQIGQTGKTVRPKLYVACGISGSAQHLAGVGSAQCIVAINKDPKAPIFQYADYGIVGDLFEVIPAIIEALKNRDFRIDRS